MANLQLKVAFFDIGGTLGDVDPEKLKIVLYPDTPGMLATFRGALGLRLGIITNTPKGVGRAQIEAMLGDAKVLALFDTGAIVTSDDVGHSKPEAGIYKAAAARMQVAPGACLYVGEEPEQVRGAIAAGMQSVLRRH